MSVVAAGGNHHFMLTPLFAKQNGGPADTAWHQVTDPLNTLLGVDTTCLLAPPEGEMPPIAVEDCLYRMLKPDEIKLGMGLPWEFIMSGTNRNRVKALGNAVTPPVAEWIIGRLTALLK
jgi:DNA (cytosine-5)-methyltransferase 1